MKKLLYITLLLLLCVAGAILLAGCKTKYNTVPEYHFRDSTKMVYQRDSIFLHDSVFVSVEARNDTVYHTKTVTKFLLTDKWRTDTVAITSRDTVVQVVNIEKPLTASQAFAIRWFGVLVAVCLIMAIWIFRKPLIILARQFI